MMTLADLGTERTRRWWARMGRGVFDPGFSQEVDHLLERSPLTDYNQRVMSWDDTRDRARRALDRPLGTRP